jgi:hypothetical protein
MNIPCPKCSSLSTRLVNEEDSLVLKCHCGYYKNMTTTLRSGMVIEHIHIEGEIQLPRKGTKLFQCLGALASLTEASTQQVAHELTRRGTEWSSDEVASFLTILKHRGLVKITQPGKGVLGGSRWALTDTARRLLKL